MDRDWRFGALAAAAAGVTLLAVACGGSPAVANTFAPGATYAQMLAFAKCMRSHGVPQFKDPDRQGSFSSAQIQALESNSSQQQNALAQCRSVLPNAGTGLSATQLQTMQQHNLRNAVKAAHCMRAHGITSFPDPGSSSQGSGINWGPVFSAGFPNDSPGYAAAFRACGGRVGGPLGPFLAPGAQNPGQGGPPPSPGPDGTVPASP